jgi:hypothetical protein
MQPKTKIAIAYITSMVVLVAGPFVFSACSPEPIGEESGGNKTQPLRLLYEFDGCKLYSFVGAGGYKHYIARCQSGAISVSGR